MELSSLTIQTKLGLSGLSSEANENAQKTSKRRETTANRNDMINLLPEGKG
jgi:hypothetical protein